MAEAGVGFHDYKCKNCGAPLIFRGDLNKMACEYCDSTFDMSEFAADTQVREETVNWQQASAQQMQAGTAGMREYFCNTCGAQLVAEENVGATECPYCGNPLVIKDTFEGMNLPDGLIPFAVDKSSAQEAMRNFYKGKKLLPKNFIDSNRVDSITGLYVPFWLFDCQASGDGYYKATQERRFNRGQETWKEIKEYAVTRQGTMRYEKVPADGAKEMKDSYMDSLEPYDYSKITPYNAAYLSGYVASKYDEDANAVKPRVDERIRTTTQEKLRSTVTGYDSVTTTQSSTQIRDGRVSYCMLPLWMLTTKWNGEAYTFAMNGQTGKVTGDLPVDSGRCVAYFFRALAIAIVIAQFLLGLCGVFRSDQIVIPELVSLVICVVCAVLALSSAKSAMKAHTSHEASHYLVEESFRLTRKEDRYLGSHEERISSGSSSGGVAARSAGPAPGARPGAGKPSQPRR